MEDVAAADGFIRHETKKGASLSTRAFDAE
jgi:hypothetical protein